MNVKEETAKKYVFPKFINSERVQTVKKDNTIGIVFYEAGEILIDGTTIQSNKPCFAIIKNGIVVSQRTEKDGESAVIVCNE